MQGHLPMACRPCPRQRSSQSTALPQPGFLEHGRASLASQGVARQLPWKFQMPKAGSPMAACLPQPGLLAKGTKLSQGSPIPPRPLLPSLLGWMLQAGAGDCLASDASWAVAHPSRALLQAVEAPI